MKNIKNVAKILRKYRISFQLKTERERVSERMIRLGKKWEAEHLLWEEKERQNEAELKIKEKELLSSDKSYIENLESGIEKLALDECFRKGELNMVDFLAKETALMLNRLKPREKKFVPFTKDIRAVDAKFVLNISDKMVEVFENSLL